MAVNKCSVIVLGLLLILTGCTQSSSTDTVKKVSQKSSSSKPVLASGKILSSQKENPDIAYKVVNKKAKFYNSLRGFGKKSEIFSDYRIVGGATLGAIQKYNTTRGTIYHVVECQADGLDYSSGPEFEDDGYVRATDLARYYPIASEWSYSQKQPCYVGNPYTYRVWTAPVGTKSYVHIAHVLDRLTATKLYITKELVTSKGKHYVYLETAKRKLGWIYKTNKALIYGRYRSPAKQFLHVAKTEKMVAYKQSNKSTGNQVGYNDSLALPQRAYLVYKHKRLSRVLTMGMDNRPIVFNIKNGRVTRAIVYQYWRVPWKTITSQKKLASHFSVWHDGSENSGSDVYFYPKDQQKLLRVQTVGLDGNADIVVYRNGRTTFTTNIGKDMITFPIAKFE
ncbi:hypothetical protein LL936_00015 [Levilactobacillus brevis]|uniref:hypothetical protein n=1 Tax=Levilactobacillus brevis TaxID=1580 RepID=UPI001F28C4D6|nr:hypothetical protein [Levilactobacillus brevis]MCE6037248.1 hypothetical protein [Levilactobacillus brevis]